MSRVVYELYRVVCALLGLLSVETVEVVARGVGVAAWWVLGSYRKLILRNLETAFGDEWSEEKRREVGRQSFACFAANMAVGIWWSRRDVRELMNQVELEGLEDFERVIRSGRGAVVILSHLGNWELAARLIPLLVKCPTGAVYQRLGNPWMDRAIRAQRTREGLQLFERKQGFHKAIEMVRSGGLVGVLADQHAGDAGYWCPFFGRLASTTPLPATMALRSGGALLSCAVYSRPGGRWKIVLSGPIELPERDVSAWTERVNAEMELQIREQPQDWLWAHNRWKTPNPDFLLGSVRRGIARGGFSRRFRLAVRSPNWLGDAVMAVPGVCALKQARPDLELTVVVPAKIADLWREIPAVDRVVPIPAGAGVFKTADLLREGNHDAVLVLPNSLRVGLEAWLAGIPRRVGLRGHMRAFFLNQLVPRREPGSSAGDSHQVHHYRHLARVIGAPDGQENVIRSQFPGSEPSAVSPWPDGNSRAESLQIAVCPGAEYGEAKRWYPERFAAVMRAVAGSYECRWHLVGVARDKPVGERIEAALRECTGRDVVFDNWIGRTSLRELISLLRACDVLVTNDTGTMHLAAVLEVPVVAVFGSTEPLLTGPLGEGHEIVQHRVPCGPCFLRQCPLDFECMKRVTVADVVAAVERVLNRAETFAKKSSPSA
jgi:lipopolysaccharide heptosyltransferase II